jgi:phage regulator Rha-like protein
MLPILQNQSVLTMSSLDIAQVVNSRHDKVKQSIERLATDNKHRSAIIQLPPLGDVTNAQGQTVSVYHVNKRDSYVIVAQLSPEFTASLVDRWQELESSNRQAIPNFNDPVAAARAWADAKESEIKALEYAEAAKPAVAAIELISGSDDSRCIRDTAKELKIKPSLLTKYLLSNAWIYRQKRDDEKLGKVMAYQHRIDQGLIEHCSVVIEQKGQTKLATSVKITGKGFAKLSLVFSDNNQKGLN